MQFWFCAGREVKKLDLPTSSNKSFCDFSSERSDVCDMKGDVRIHGASSSVFFIRNRQNGDQVGEEEIVRIRPYPRKFDRSLLERIGEIKITSTGDRARAYTCKENQSIPAIVFANGGFLGNFYHDFNDALIPLFITSRQFDGEVQLLITNMQPWWIQKYKPVLSKLSNYQLIDLKNEGRVRCYPRMIVNLHSHRKISINPSRTPGNYSMVDFARFLRKAYSLDREFADISQRKPKILIITRRRTRKFTNMEAIISMAEQLGYEVLAQEIDPNIKEFSKIVNSCDVMMGVHGAGLTHLMFLPDNAVHIQVAPLGKPSSREDYGLPAIDRNLRYIQYNISEEESTLIEKYPRDHPVFTDPDSIHRQGYAVSFRIYLVEQSVKLNATRFRPVLERALELLRKQ